MLSCANVPLRGSVEANNASGPPGACAVSHVSQPLDVANAMPMDDALYARSASSFVVRLVPGAMSPIPGRFVYV